MHLLPVHVKIIHPWGSETTLLTRKRFLFAMHCSDMHVQSGFCPITSYTFDLSFFLNKISAKNKGIFFQVLLWASLLTLFNLYIFFLGGGVLPSLFRRNLEKTTFKRFLVDFPHSGYSHLKGSSLSWLENKQITRGAYFLFCPWGRGENMRFW